jgi:hypothetical protein
MGIGLAIKFHPSYINNVLNQTVVEQYKSIDESLDKHWAQETRRHEIAQMKGCLDKFVTSMLQLDRMITHQNLELTNPLNLIPIPGVMNSSAIREACSDFEALLLQSKAALDRLTWFISQQFKQSSTSFSKLRNILNDKKKDPRADAILLLLDEATWLKSIFIDQESVDRKSGEKRTYRGLRNTIAHYQSIRERVDNCFGIYRRSSDQILFYDMESNGVPMYKTCFQITKYLSFLILNSLSIFIDGRTLGLSKYEPKWENFTVVVSEYKSDKGSTLPVGKRFTPNGWEMERMHVSDEIYTKALNLKTVSKSQEADYLGQGWKNIGNISEEEVVLLK